MTDRLIEPDPGGRPVIAGTHITVAEVLKELAEWGEVDWVLTAHPELDREAVRAALEFAARSLPPAPAAEKPAASESYRPRTEFGKTMWSAAPGGRRGSAGARRAVAGELGGRAVRSAGAAGWWARF